MKGPTWDHTTDILDDDPDRPLFLAKAADVFAANGVRFEIQGFFEQPLPVSTDVGLVYFLEDLPGILKFLTAPAPASYSVGLWQQGIEAEFSFSTREHGDMVDVACSCAAHRKMSHEREQLRRRLLLRKITEFVENYLEATKRYVPQFLNEGCNRDISRAAALATPQGQRKQRAGV